MNKNYAGSTKYTVTGTNKKYSSAYEAELAKKSLIDKAYNDAYKQAMTYAIPDQSAKTANAKAIANQAKAEAEKKFRVISTKFTGTDSAQPGDTLVGERGHEIVVNNDGTATIVDEPTIMKLKGGEKIFNAKDTDKILKKTVPLKNYNPKKFALLHSFANGTNSPMQTRIAAQAVGLANVLSTGMLAVPNAGGQNINNTFNVSLPNITDSSKATDLFKEFQHLQVKATQYFNK